MSDQHISLEILGWNPRLEAQAIREGRPLATVARVAAVDRDQLLLLNGSGTFRAKLAGSYRDCSHSGEPSCAVREAVNAGEIDADHDENYRKPKEEAAFYQMSHAEKRKKDRDFGRFIKSVKKDLARD